MKLECQTKNLKEAVQKTNKLVVKNSSLPILNTIFIKALGKSLVLRSTNLHIGIEIEIPANIEKEGEFIVSGEVFSKIFTTISEKGIVFIEITKNIMTIKTEKSVVSVNSSGDISDFPSLPVVEGSSFSLPLSVFLDGMKSVYYCASVSDIKPEISSVFVYSDSNELVFVSTDSFRLAEKKVTVDGLPDISGILIPYKNIIEIIRLFSDISDLEELALFTFNENQINISLPGLFVTSRIVDGMYPKYQAIIPKEFKTEVVSFKNDMLDALKLSTIFSDKFNQISLSVDSQLSSCLMKAKNSQKGENVSNIDTTINGESIEMNFNYKYFQEGFQSISTDSVVLQFNEENKPVVIQGVGDKSFLYLIMPMNR